MHPGFVRFDHAKDVEAILKTFHDRGYKDIDTARNYGASEEKLGQAEVANRFIIHTKVKSGVPGDHQSSNIESSVKQSLENLKTSTVETMFLHAPDRQTPFEDTIGAIDDALKKGKFKNFGLSNYTPAEVQQVIDICEQKGYTKPSVYQGQYNMIVRGGEKELFPLLRKHGIAFFGFRYDHTIVTYALGLTFHQPCSGWLLLGPRYHVVTVERRCKIPVAACSCHLIETEHCW